MFNQSIITSLSLRKWKQIKNIEIIRVNFSSRHLSRFFMQYFIQLFYFIFIYNYSIKFSFLLVFIFQKWLKLYLFFKVDWNDEKIFCKIIIWKKSQAKYLSSFIKIRNSLEFLFSNKMKHYNSDTENDLFGIYGLHLISTIDQNFIHI